MISQSNCHFVFFDLLRVTIGRQESLSQTPSEREWQAIFEIAQRHALVGVCLTGLEKLSNQDQRPPKELLLNWIGISQQIEQLNMIVNKRCLELQKKLSAEGFKYCILKGQGNAIKYGKISPKLALLRQSGDIDVWVAGGYDKVLRYVENVRPTEEVNEQHVQLHLFDDTEVEVHFTPSRLSNRLLDRKLQQLYLSEVDRQMSHAVEFEGDRIVMPTDDFNLVYQMLHIYRHLFSTEGIGLRQLMDYYVLLTVSNLTEDERVQVNRLVKSFGMERFASSLMWVLKYVFLLPESKMLWSADEKRGHFVLSEVMQMGNFGHSDNRFKLNANESHLQRYWKMIKSKMRFFKYFPCEALWEPIDYFFRFFEIKAAKKRARELMTKMA